MTQSTAAEALKAVAKKNNTKSQTLGTGTKKKSNTKKSGTSIAKAAATPAVNRNNAVQTPAPDVSKVSINDFKLYVAYGNQYTLTVIAPQNDPKYNYIFKAKENKGEDIGVISVARAGPDSFSRNPPKEDTYYHITLEVKGINGRISGVAW